MIVAEPSLAYGHAVGCGIELDCGGDAVAADGKGLELGAGAENVGCYGALGHAACIVAVGEVGEDEG